MPTYEYQCSACGHFLEAFQKMSDEPLKVCPKCQQATLSKQVSATNFQLKGTGWYVTDFRDKDKPKPKDTGAAEKPASKPADSGSNTSNTGTE